MSEINIPTAKERICANMRSTTTTLTATAKNNNNGNLKSSNNKVKFVLLQPKKSNNHKREASPSPELQSKDDANCDFKKTKTTLAAVAADAKPSAKMTDSVDTNTSIIKGSSTAAAGPKITPPKESQGDENNLSPRSVSYDHRVTTTCKLGAQLRTWHSYKTMMT